MKNVHEIKCEIKGKEWVEAIDNAWKKISKKVKIDGFRDGKVPRSVYEEKFGKEVLYQEAVEGSLNTLYADVLKNSDLIPVASPSVDITSYDENQATLTFTVTTAPEVKIKNYKKLGVEKDLVEVTDEELNSEVAKILNDYAELVTKEGKVENLDTVIIDYVGKKDGVAFEGGTAENYSLKIGSNTFIPGFEEAVIGMSLNDTKDINLKFPEEYPSEDLKGADVVFTVTVNEIKVEQLPTLDEDFFLDLGMEDVKNEDELRKFIKENMLLRKEGEAENKYIDALIKKIAEDTEIDIPEIMVEDEVKRIFKEFNDRLSMQGMNINDYFKFTGANEETLKETVKPEAIERIKSRLILDEIVKMENLTATKEEVEKRIEELAVHYNMTKEDLIKEFNDEDLLEYEVKIKKAIEVLKANN